MDSNQSKYANSFTASYVLSVGGSSRDETSVPAVNGISEIQNTVDEVARGVKAIEHADTSVTMSMDNAEILLRVSTNKNPADVLERLIFVRAIPNSVYAELTTRDELEGRLSAYNLTTLYSRKMPENSFLERIERKWAQRTERIHDEHKMQTFGLHYLISPSQ